MSIQQDRFEQAAKARDWETAFRELNGLNMYEILRALNRLSSAIRDQIKAKMPAFDMRYNTPRIMYAMVVVNQRKLPEFVPGDLYVTKQVDTALEFLEELAAASRPQSKAGKLVFTTMDAAGIAALDEILSRSISEGVEFAGLLFKQGARFGFTAPVRGKPDSALPLPKIKPTGGSPAEIQAAIQGSINAAKGLVPAGTDPVGIYHTHGNKQNAETFSPEDRGFHNLRHWFGYLGTPTRAILKFTPKNRPPDEHPWLAVFGGEPELLRRSQK